MGDQRIRDQMKLVRQLLKGIASRINPEIYERALAHAQYRKLKAELAGARLCSSRESVWDVAIAELGSDAPVRYLEFGVFHGYSIGYFAGKMCNPEARFCGFDSFEGLPESWTSYDRGKFSTGGALPRVDDLRISFVKGWFQNTVPGFLDSDERWRTPQGPVMVHFDADLYSSTLFLLTSLWHWVPNYYFLFDEFMGHELRAWCAFREAFPVSATIVAYDLQDGFPCRVFGSMKRIPAQLEECSE